MAPPGGKPVRRESAVVRSVLTFLRTHGATAIKLHGSGFQPMGLDIIACYRGRYLELEAKRSPKEKPTPRQLHRIAEVKEAGGVAAVVYSTDDVACLLNQIEEADESAADNSRALDASNGDPE